MNEISETFMRETSDGSIRWSTSMYGAKKFDSEQEAHKTIDRSKLKSCKVTKFIECCMSEVKS